MSALQSARNLDTRGGLHAPPMAQHVEGLSFGSKKLTVRRACLITTIIQMKCLRRWDCKHTKAAVASRLSTPCVC